MYLIFLNDSEMTLGHYGVSKLLSKNHQWNVDMQTCNKIMSLIREQ